MIRVYRIGVMRIMQISRTLQEYYKFNRDIGYMKVCVCVLTKIMRKGTFDVFTHINLISKF